ncbi:MAG: hypothetical protein ABI548_11070 [Polyangiaceae bacterium]
MATWVPYIFRGPCSTTYAAVVHISHQAPSDPDYDLLTLQAAIDKVEQELTKVFKDGDQIFVGCNHLTSVDLGMAAIVKKYGHVPPTVPWPEFAAAAGGLNESD